MQRRQCTDEGSRLRPNNLVFDGIKSHLIIATKGLDDLNGGKNKPNQKIDAKIEFANISRLFALKVMKIVKKLRVNQGF